MLQQTDLVDHALKISPYNALAYGLLVALLIVALIWVTRQWMKDKDFIQSFSKDFISLTTKLLGAMDEDKANTANLYRETQDTNKLNTAILNEIKMELYKIRTERESK